MKPMSKRCTIWFGMALAAGLTGCVAQRGVNFGHWAGSPEMIPLTRPYNIRKSEKPVASDLIALLPPLGVMEEKNSAEFQQRILQEAQKYFAARVIDIDPQGPLSEYLSVENLAPTTGIFDFQEVGRVGRLMSAKYVLAVWVREVRSHPPQRVSLYLAMVESASGAAVGEMEATFDAKEQQVVVALRNNLQSRRAREFDDSSLDVMLRSPSEFQGFVATVTCRELAHALWP